MAQMRGNSPKYMINMYFMDGMFHNLLIKFISSKVQFRFSCGDIHKCQLLTWYIHRIYYVLLYVSCLGWGNNSSSKLDF